MGATGRKREHANGLVLGIDFGSTTLSVAAIEPSGRVHRSIYHRHQGRLAESLEMVFEEIDPTAVDRVAVVKRFFKSICSLAKRHGADLKVFGTVTTVSGRGFIEAVTGVPVVNIVDDGTGGSKNVAVIPHLQYPRRAAASVGGRLGRSA